LSTLYATYLVSFSIDDVKERVGVRDKLVTAKLARVNDHFQ